MSENRILYSNTPPSPEGTSQEAQLRQALELMGGRRAASPGQGKNHQVNSPSRSSGAAPQRHRYVRDGEIPVVHAALGRQSNRLPEPNSQYDKAIVESLRLDLEHERSARESAERLVAEGRHAMTSLQTRVAHLEMDLQAAQEQAVAQQALFEAAQHLSEPVISQAVSQQGIPRHRRETPAPKIMSVKTARKLDPKPVKWWIRPD